MFDEEYQEYYEEPDYEAYEKLQLDRDRAMGEFEPYDPEAYLYEPVEEFESDLWDDILGDST